METDVGGTTASEISGRTNKEKIFHAGAVTKKINTDLIFIS
jgi:hypothetical protein